MSKDKKTLVILIPGFPKNEEDSTCLPFPQLFVKTLKKQNPYLNIIVLAFQYPFSNTPYSWHDVSVIPINGKEKGKFRRLQTWKKVLHSFNIIKKEKNVFGILNFWMGECAFIGRYISKIHRIPSFNWLMGQDARKGNRYIAVIKPKASNTIALSDFLATEFYKNYKIRPALIIPPGIDPADFTLHSLDRDIDIIGVGSLIPLKQFDIFIRIVIKMTEKFPAVKAVICGKGPEKKRLVEMIASAGLHKNIILLDETRHEVVLNLMQHSKILLHTSSYEGFATVYSEALCAGVHVVGFCQPMISLYKHQNTVMYENEMAAVVDRLLSIENLDHSAVIPYRIEETCKKILALYK